MREGGKEGGILETKAGFGEKGGERYRDKEALTKIGRKKD